MPSPDEVAAALGALKLELSDWPRERTSALSHVQRVRPELADDGHMLGFLRAEGFDVKRAAERLLDYWTARQEVFGPEKYALPLTLNEAMRDDVGAVRSGFLSLLPTTDERGRAIFYHLSSAQAKRVTLDEKIRVMWYVTHVAMEDPGVAEAGFVVLSNAREVNGGRSMAKFVRTACESDRIFPIRWHGTHLCHSRAMVQPLIGQVVRSVISRLWGDELVLHNGPDESVVEELLGHSFRRDCIPASLGGDLHFSIHEFVAKRLAIEEGVADFEDCDVVLERTLPESEDDHETDRAAKKRTSLHEEAQTTLFKADGDCETDRAARQPSTFHEEAQTAPLESEGDHEVVRSARKTSTLHEEAQMILLESDGDDETDRAARKPDTLHEEAQMLPLESKVDYETDRSAKKPSTLHEEPSRTDSNPAFEAEVCGAGFATEAGTPPLAQDISNTIDGRGVDVNGGYFEERQTKRVRRWGGGEDGEGPIHGILDVDQRDDEIERSHAAVNFHPPLAKAIVMRVEEEVVDPSPGRDAMASDPSSCITAAATAAAITGLSASQQKLGNIPQLANKQTDRAFQGGGETRDARKALPLPNCRPGRDIAGAASITGLFAGQKEPGNTPQLANMQFDNAPWGGKETSDTRNVRPLPDSEPKESMAVIPHQNDVLFGRGKAIDNHPGNLHFRSVIEKHRPRSARAELKAKQGIAKDVMNEIFSLKPPGRFLVEDFGAHGIKAWVPAKFEKALDKTMHRLREKKKRNSAARQIQLADKTAVRQCPTKNTHGATPIPDGTIPDGKKTNQHAMLEGIDTAESLLVARTSIRVSLRDWMQPFFRLPGKSSYVENAASLSWMLTKHLSAVMPALAKSKLGNPVDDHVNAENVIIFVEPRSLSLHCNGGPLSVTDAKFQFKLPGMSSLPSVPTHAGGSSPSSLIRAVCAALGKTLLAIFSMGNCSPSKVFNGAASSNYSDCAQNNRTIAEMPPAGKLEATVPTNGSISSWAKSCLVESGMPLSICQLVGDLLDAGDEKCPSTAITSLEDALWDLSCMNDNPRSFLFDRTCPQQALDDTCLFGSTDDQVLFGREEEMAVLLTAKDRVSTHVHRENNAIESVSVQGASFGCEAVILSGYAGSGKSSLLKSLVRSCNKEQWFILRCNFDNPTAPMKVLAKAFDDFFGKWGLTDHGTHPDINPPMLKQFHHVCRNILSTLDANAHLLFDHVPTFSKIFPRLGARRNNQGQEVISSMDKFGSAKNRLQHLFRVLFKSICSAGCPVLLTLDNLQWSGPFAMECLTDFIVNDIYDESSRRGLLLVGAYRTNEVQESGDLMTRINLLKQSNKVHTSVLTVGAIPKRDITKLISAKLCLPRRYTEELGCLVHGKTSGNPFFVIQFLKTIIQNKMLEFPIRSCRWVWDYDVVEVMISYGVAELLTTTFNMLPTALINTIKIISCFGLQVKESTIHALDSRKKVLPFNMLAQLELAVKEGILEKAGLVYQFTHDIVQETVYSLIPSSNRKLLHKTIGEDLLESAVNNHAVHLLAVDQINQFCKDGNPNTEERPRFAKSNALAAKSAIATSNIDQARSYIDAGIQLLETQHWETHYSLSLDLFEMSASVSCMCGDTARMSSCLDEILSHAETFDDSLIALSLLPKLLASSSKFEEAKNNCLVTLSSLGEVFPKVISLPLVLNELSVMQATLRSITCERIELLPPNTNQVKLLAMKFLNILCLYSLRSKPLLVPLLSCRMIKLTLEHGFCDDAIVGLATACLSVFLFTEDIQLASHLGQVSGSLVEKSPNKHVLRSRLCNELVLTFRMFTEPLQSVASLLPELYNSAMLAGDIESADSCRHAYCSALFYSGSLDLSSVATHSVKCIKEAAKYKRDTGLYYIMGTLQTCLHLSGKRNNKVELKSLDELNNIGEDTNNNSLVWNVFMNRMSIHFWMREYLAVAELSEKHSEKYRSSQHKRFLGVMRCFYEGIAYLSLARDTGQAKWRVLGEKAVTRMSQLETVSKWNYENKSMLLQAELHYLNGDMKSADVAYKASIKSACEHKFLHEEALACELYGRFHANHHMIKERCEQFFIAAGKYREWGAAKKVDELALTLPSKTGTN